VSSPRTSGDRAGRRKSGLAAEQAALRHLESQGWTLLARNHVVRGGELDLVMRDGTTVVFVEVRLRRSGDEALASITPRKVARVVRAAELYLAGQRFGDAPVRFDVVCACRRADGTFALTHLCNAFDASDAGN
jgi:putative endonuclease